MKSLALGTVIRVEDPTTPGTFIKVGNVSAIPGLPGPTKPEVDVTDFDSTGAEFLPGLPDFGSFEFTVNYNAADAGQVILFDDAQDPEAPVRNFQVDFTRQDERFEFAGYVASFTPVASGPNAAYTANGSIRVSGSVTKTNPIPVGP